MENWKAQLSFKAGEGMLNLRFETQAELQNFVMIEKHSQGLVDACLRMLDPTNKPVLQPQVSAPAQPARTPVAQVREVLTSKEPNCKSCGSAMWDNRTKKSSPKAPDWKCKSKSCSYVNPAGYAGDAAWVRFNKKTGHEFLSWASETKKEEAPKDDTLPSSTNLPF